MRDFAKALFKLISILPLAALQGGCHPAATPLVAVGAVEVGSVAVFGKGSVDMLYSAVTGKDCSIVRLDKGETYCRQKAPAPPPEPFCTRTLGLAQCFSDPAALADHPLALGDTPLPAGLPPAARLSAALHP